MKSRNHILLGFVVFCSRYQEIRPSVIATGRSFVSSGKTKSSHTEHQMGKWLGRMILKVTSMKFGRLVVPHISYIG